MQITILFITMWLFYSTKFDHGQGHATVLGYLQSLCEVGPSIFFPRNCSDRHNEWTDIVIHMTNSNFIYG